jgi:hypothetical protein
MQRNILAQHDDQSDFWMAVDKELDALRSECPDRTAISRYDIALRIACAMLTSLSRLVSKILHEDLTRYGDFDLESVAGTRPSAGQDIADREVVDSICDASPIQEHVRPE